MPAIRAIFWDVGGVLLTNGWDHLERTAVLKQFALDPGPFEQRHEMANDPWEKGLMTAEQYLLQTVFYEPAHDSGHDPLTGWVTAIDPRR